MCEAQAEGVETFGNVGYVFDEDGYLKLKNSIDGNVTYSYSRTGELLKVIKEDNTTIEYTHDPLGRRVAKSLDGVVIEKYLWLDKTTLLAVYDSSDTLVARFNYADSRVPFSMEKDGSLYYLFYDQVGTLRVVSDSSGNVVKEINYDSFGNIITDSNPDFKVPFGFAGGLHDRDINFVRFGFRDYDPHIGKWTARDPILFEGGDSNLYGYVLNDPINLVDVEGKNPLVIAGMFAGGGLDLAIQVNNKGWSNVNWQQVGISTITGGIGGFAKTIGQASIIGGVGAGVNDINHQTSGGCNMGNISWTSTGKSALSGAFAGGIGGAGGALGKQIIKPNMQLGKPIKPLQDYEVHGSSLGAIGGTTMSNEIFQ